MRSCKSYLTLLNWEFDDDKSGHIELNEMHDFLAFFYEPMFESYVVDGVVTRERFGEVPRVPVPSENSGRLTSDQYCAYTQALANYNIMAVWDDSFGENIAQVTKAQFAYTMFSGIDQRYADGLTYSEFQQVVQEYATLENDHRLYDDLHSTAETYDLVNPNDFTAANLPAHCARRKLFMCFGICVGVGVMFGAALEFIGAETVATAAAGIFDWGVVQGARLGIGFAARQAGAVMFGNAGRIGFQAIAAAGMRAQMIYAPEAMAGIGLALRQGAGLAVRAGAPLLPFRRLLQLELDESAAESSDALFLQCPVEAFPLDLLN